MLGPPERGLTNARTTSRLNTIRTVIEAEEVYLGTRIAAVIFLLYGTPIGKLSSLRSNQIHADANGMTIALGSQPAPIPEALVPSSTLICATAQKADP